MYTHIQPAYAEQRKVIMGNLLANRKLEKAGKIQNGHESFKQFDNSKTLALCGAGPSLEKHIDEIHERDDLEIIGINRAGMHLKKGSMFLMDRCVSPMSFANHKDMDLLALCYANSDVTEMPWKNVYMFHDDALIDSHWKDTGYPFIYTNSCTTISVLHYAYMCGFNRVEVFGNDFAWQKNYYADKLPEHNPIEGPIPVDVNGEKWFTNKMLFDQAHMVKMACKFLENSGVEIINRSAGIFDWGKK